MVCKRMRRHYIDMRAHAFCSPFSTSNASVNPDANLLEMAEIRRATRLFASSYAFDSRFRLVTFVFRVVTSQSELVGPLLLPAKYTQRMNNPVASPPASDWPIILYSPLR